MNYFVGVAASNDPSFSGIVEALQMGFQGERWVHFYETDGSTESMRGACQLFLRNAPPGADRAFIAGYSTAELLAARAELPKDVFVVSLGSSLNDLSGLPNAVSFGFSDETEANAMFHAILYNHTGDAQRIHAVLPNGNTYAADYLDSFVRALSRSPQRVKLNFDAAADAHRYDGDAAAVLKDIGRVAKDGDILVIIGYPADFARASGVLAAFPKVTVYCSDTMDTVKGELGNLDAYVAIPAIVDYTAATRRFYSELYRRYPRLLRYSRYATPFVYDCTSLLRGAVREARRLNADGLAASAAAVAEKRVALSAAFIDPHLKRPDFGLYWMCQTRDDVWSENLVDFRRLTLGSSHALMQSAAVGMKVGTAFWSEPGGIVLSVGEWQRLVNNDGVWIFTRLGFQGIEVDTARAYRSNEDSNAPPQNLGVYSAGPNESGVMVVTRRGKSDIVRLDDRQQFPLPLRTVDLLL